MKIYIVHQWIPYDGYWHESYFRDLHDALIYWQYKVSQQIDRQCNGSFEEYRKELELDYDTLAEAIRDEDRLFYETWEIREVEVI